MTKVHHVNCGFLHAPPNPRVVCHCVLLEDPSGLALIDTGIGLRDADRLAPELVTMAGFQFGEADTAVRQVEGLGFRTADVTHAVLTHGDPDHAGGLSDFPHARVHVSEEEHARLFSGHWRYVPAQFAHGPRWATYPRTTRRWYGLEARTVDLGFESEVLLIPLFGHTLGHCGVAIGQGDRWILHVGDAYYLRVETQTDDHPVSVLAAQRADDDAIRRASLAEIRRLLRDHGDEIEMLGYHDPSEFPQRRATPQRS